ncbi:hypothetical protein ACYOEI_18700 [Singulisphaera rosea]
MVVPSKENEDRSAAGGIRQRRTVDATSWRLIGWRKECRRIVSRYEKTAVNCVGMIKMTFIKRYLRITC